MVWRNEIIAQSRTTDAIRLWLDAGRNKLLLVMTKLPPPPEVIYPTILCRFCLQIIYEKFFARCQKSKNPAKCCWAALTALKSRFRG